MKKIWILSFLLIGFQLSAQQETDKKLLEIDKQIKEIIAQKSKEFQARLDTINLHLQKGDINREDAEFQKKELAKHYADDLDYAIFKLTKDLKQVAKGRQAIDSTVNQDADYTVHRITLNLRHQRDYNVHQDKQVFSYFYIAGGANNVIVDEDITSLEDSPYGIPDSRFLEMGIDWKRNLSHHKLLLKYGFSFTWNTLKPTDNRYHFVENDTLKILPHPNDLSRSKLRSIWLKLPVALEIDLPEAGKQHLRLSAGVYGKIRCTTKQKLTFDNGNGDTDQVTKADYNMPKFNYGLSAEIGGTTWSIYANYDLNSLFENRNWYLLSLGVKLEL